MAIIKIDNVDQFNKEIKEGKVLVDFYADWCGPCKMLAPIIEQVAEENPDLKVLEVNVDNVPDLAKEYQVMSIPTLIMFKDGKQTNKAIGLQPKQQLEAFIK
ncbi:thioredoxin [Mesoplasma lactucae]|uniref:Thioredoxin n=1 Tax=Mesoplasma lactucae ATCC 49193 TaxID=81460 RepID=A0A291IS53_9MOLU|nr:thioredoxin [Mesoplasma lactucae]ATG97603.1 thioredoxin [Mesoplasma lactucae ATCC 49193]ATZ19936.1 thioredoxin [Mesoplasma lactucae ATCC 49193]MCL8217113.1 Thioredoxin [Mesoplasma lactucae ATCC 49193]